MSLILTPTSSIYSPTSSIVVTNEALVSPEVLLSSISPLYPLNKPITVSFEYTKPLIGVYETIDTNPEVRAKMVSYYYDLIRDKWLLDELNDILNYFIYRDGKVSMIKSASEYNPANIAKDTDKIAEAKVEYIEKNIFSKKQLAKFINRFSQETYTKWVDIPRNEYLFRTALKEYLLKLIRRELKSQKGGGCGDGDGHDFDIDEIFQIGGNGDDDDNDDDFDYDQIFQSGGGHNGYYSKFDFETLFRV